MKTLIVTAIVIGLLAIATLGVVSFIKATNSTEAEPTSEPVCSVNGGCSATCSHSSTNAGESCGCGASCGCSGAGGCGCKN